MLDQPELPTWLTVLYQERQLLAYLLLHRHAPPRRQEAAIAARIDPERLLLLLDQQVVQERAGRLLLAPDLYAWLSDRLGLARPLPASALAAGFEALQQTLTAYQAASGTPLAGRCREQLWQCLQALPFTLRACEAYRIDLLQQLSGPELPEALQQHLRASGETHRRALHACCDLWLAWLDEASFPRTEPAAYWAPAWQTLQAQVAELRDTLSQAPPEPTPNRATKLQHLAYLRAQQELLLRTNLETLLAEESALVWGPKLSWQPRPDPEAGWPTAAWQLRGLDLRRPAPAVAASEAPPLQAWLQAAQDQPLDLLGFLLQQTDLPLPPEVLYFELLARYPDAWVVQDAYRTYQGWEYAEVYARGGE